MDKYKKDEIYKELLQFVHYKDEVTIPFYFEQYEGKLDELQSFVDDVRDKLLALHKLCFGYDKFTTLYVDNIGCISDSFYENREKYEDYKSFSFIGFICYMSMLVEVDLIELDELKTMLNDLFDEDWEWVTDGVELMQKEFFAEARDVAERDGFDWDAAKDEIVQELAK